MKKCAYIKCDIYFEKYRNKKFCSYKHNTLQWLLANPERRRAIETKYERKNGVITRQEWAESIRGENNPNYTGKAFRTNKESWRKLALEIKIRDNFTCASCGR